MSVIQCTNQTTPRGRSWFALALAMLVLLWSQPAAAQNSGSLTAQIDGARAEHQRLLNIFEIERAQFEDVLAEIDALTEERRDDTPLDSGEALRDSLREARAMALDLAGRSQSLRSLVGTIADLEGQMLTSLDVQIQGLENQLPDADSASRGRLLADLGRLSTRRYDYLQPLPETPDVDLDAILLGLEDEMTPEEMFATADELDDNERRLLEHLIQLEDRIGDLEHQVELEQRTREFLADNSLFEENLSSGARRPTQQVITSTSSGSADEARSGDDQTGGGSVEVTETADNRGTANSAGGGEGDDDGTAAPAADETQDTDGDGFSEGTDPGASDGLTTSGDGGGLESEVPSDIEPDLSPAIDLNGPALSGFTLSQSPDEDVIWLVGAPEAEREISGGVRGRIDQLRGERDRTRDTINELRLRRDELLQRAEELEGLEY